MLKFFATSENMKKKQSKDSSDNRGKVARKTGV